MTCETCRYWQHTEAQASSGECRRHAPTCSDAHTSSMVWALWRRTKCADWCGEWEERPAVTAKAIGDFEVTTTGLAGAYTVGS